MSYFLNVRNGDELKAKYRELCKTNHPDKGGDTEEMKTINDEYSKMKLKFFNCNFHDTNINKKTNQSQFAKLLANAQEEIKRMKDDEDKKTTQKSKPQNDADKEKAKAKLKREEQKRKDLENDAQRIAKEKSYKSQFFPNQEMILCVAQGGASRLLTAWETDSFIKCMQRDGIGIIIHQTHFEYSLKPQKRKK